jgi:ATP-dependent Clp protease ATP-binding subunit ClpA
MEIISLNSAAAAIGFVALIGIVFYVQSKRRGASYMGSDDGKMSFLLNLTALAKAGKIQKVVGMEDVVDRLIHVLSRRHKSNPLLIGEPGVGKTAAVELLAQRVVGGSMPKNLNGVNIYALNLGELMAGTKYRGDLEKRLQKLLDNLEGQAKKNILFIDEIQMIEQARGVEGGLDLADIIKPALSRGELRVIGATTWKEYEEILKPDSAVERRFQPVLVNEPTPDETFSIIRGVKDEYENYHGVYLPDETIRKAVDLAADHIHSRHMPDKALDVIDEACAKVAIESKNGKKTENQNTSLDNPGSGNGHPTVQPEDAEAIVNQWIKFNN